MKTIEQQKKVAQEIYKKLKIIDPYSLLAGEHRGTGILTTYKMILTSISSQQALRWRL